jgi:dipeptidyl aminopeptidase/acylaminoacyl peptidase
MAGIATLFKWTGVTLGVAVVLLCGTLAWLAFVPPAPDRPQPRHVPDQSAFELDEKVGWYRADDGTQRLVTWGADGGLTIADLAAVRNYYLTPVTADSFTWVEHRKKEAYPVRFQRQPWDGIGGFTWTLPDGARHVATRLVPQPYAQREVRFRNGDVQLAGWLLEPLAGGRCPAVAFIHGSGVSDRDMLWYVSIADFLARRGVVVLLPDKRGCGKSGGEWRTSSFADYAGDAVAAVDFLQRIEGVDPRRVGLIGMSQGGFIAPLAAGRSDAVGFIISFSGSACSLRETMRHEISCDMRNRGLPGPIVSVLEPIFERRAMMELPEFYRINGRFDPIESWRRLSVPALVLNGALDTNLPVAESTRRLEAVRRENAKAPVTIRVYADSGHGLAAPGTRAIRQDALATMADWILGAGR